MLRPHIMSSSLIEILLDIVKAGRKEVEKITESITEGTRIRLQTNELVIPSRDANYQSLFHDFQNTYSPSDWHNRLIYGDNLLVMQALLVGDEANGLPSMRGKIDLIYIDPPFDSKADYRTKIVLPGTNFDQKPTVIEQTAYSDMRKDGTASYLAYMYPRLALMRELLSETGSIYVHIDRHVGHYVKILLDEIFGKENFLNEIIWKRSNMKGAKVNSKQYGRNHDAIYYYSKSENYIYNQIYKPYSKEYIKKRFYLSDDRGFYCLQPIGTRSKESIEELRKKNKIITTSNGHERIKFYLDDME